MTQADGNTYVYDGHNGRVKTLDGNGTRYSMYSLLNGKLVQEQIDGANREYYYLGSQLVAQQGAGSQTYIHPDLLGTTAAKTNSSGTVIKRLRYAPFGLQWGHTNAESGENEIGYTGHKHDKDIGLTYMQARYYDPVIGRFYSNDPIGVRDVHSFNRYAYANNNPYRYTDPDGMAPRRRGDTGQAIAELVMISTGLMTLEEVQMARGEGGSSKKKGGKTKNSQLTQLKKDARIPKSQPAEKVEKVKMTDANGQTVKRDDGNKVVIQDHSAGHKDFTGDASKPHLNVRPAAGTKTGTVNGTKSHYVIEDKKGNQ
jgi:RHS repeat-associated protein